MAIDIDGLETPVLYNQTEINGSSSQISYNTPNGGTLTLPNASDVELFCTENNYLLNGQVIKVVDEGVRSFNYGGTKYSAYFKVSDGTFACYMDADGNILSTSQNSLPDWKLSSTFSLGLVWTRAGATALTDGSEPGPSDLVGLGYGLLGTLVWAALQYNLKNDVSITPPDNPFEGFKLKTNDSDIETIDDKKWLEEKIGDIEEFKDEYFPGQGGEFDVKRKKVQVN